MADKSSFLFHFFFMFQNIFQLISYLICRHRLFRGINHIFRSLQLLECKHELCFHIINCVTRRRRFCKHVYETFGRKFHTSCACLSLFVCPWVWMKRALPYFTRALHSFLSSFEDGFQRDWIKHTSSSISFHIHTAVINTRKVYEQLERMMNNNNKNIIFILYLLLIPYVSINHINIESFIWIDRVCKRWIGSVAH